MANTSATKRFGNPEFNKNRPSRDETKTAEYYKDICPKCGARRVDAQIGLEPTPEAYVTNIVAVMRECWRVMREDATLWLVIGDSYASSGKGDVLGKSSTLNGGRGLGENDKVSVMKSGRAPTPPGLKPKDLIGIPWRVAFALQADGWYLRSDIIWHKPNPMPESVTDRPTKAHEYVFLLAKQERYWYDAEAVKEKTESIQGPRPFGGAGNGKQNKDRHDYMYDGDNGYRNRRTVWTIATSPYSGAHFATFPPALVEPMILAGTSPQACEHCGAAWERVIEKSGEYTTQWGLNHSDTRLELQRNGSRRDVAKDKMMVGIYSTTGWRPTCECPDNTGSGKCIVLDPFSGSGTVGRVCARLGRSFVGGELNPAYIELAQHRTSGVQIAALL